MNWTEVRNRWVQLKGDVKKTWSRLSDEDIETIRGKRDTLETLICKRYDISEPCAQKQVDTWKRRQT